MGASIYGPLETHCISRLERFWSHFETLHSSHQHTYRFEPLLSRPSKSTFDGRHACHELSVLLLNQDPVTFLNLVLPHEFAHMAISTQAVVEGEDFKEHGAEWRSILMDIDEESAMVPKVESEFFDTRACRILSGSVPFTCQCDHDEGLQVIANIARSIKPYFDGEILCDICSEPLRATDRNAIQGKVSREMQFLVDRNHRE